MPSNTKFIIDHIWTSGANNKLIIKLIIFTFKYPCDIDFHSLAGKKKIYILYISDKAGYKY